MKHVLQWVPYSGSLLLHGEANANLSQLLSTNITIRKILRADKNNGLEVTTATIIIWTPLPGSACFHSEAAQKAAPKALERLPKTISTTTHDSTGAGWETGRRCREDQSLSPQQNPAVGCYKAQKLGFQYLSLTPTSAHLLSLPWLMRWGAAPFTRSHTFLHLLLQNQSCISLSRKSNRALPSGFYYYEIWSASKHACKGHD